MFESRNFRGLKTKGLKNNNNELTLAEIHYNIKKFEKHTTNKFLKLLLNIIRKTKKTNKNIDFTLFDKYQDNYLFQNDVLKDIRNTNKK